MRLVGTTKTTIASVRDRTHWNIQTLAPADPVILGLCSQIDLDFEVARAAKSKGIKAEEHPTTTLLPAEATTAKDELVTAEDMKAHEGEKKEGSVDLSKVFDRFSKTKSNG